MKNTERDNIFLHTQKNIQYINSVITHAPAYGIMITKMETDLTTTLGIVKHYALIVMQRKHVD
jgi:hypothetical protein